MTTTATAAPELSNEEIFRYSRHLILPESGSRGRRSSRRARAARRRRRARLARRALSRRGRRRHARPRRLRRRRRDEPAAPDPARHARHRPPKLESARDRIEDINPNVKVEPHETRSRRATRSRSSRTYDIVVDGTDNFPTRYLVNDACVLLGKPNVYGSIFRFDGQASVFATDGGPCYRCLYPRAAAARPRAELRRGRRARRAAGRHRHDPGDRGDQADPRHRRAARRPAAALRRAAHELPHAQAAQGSRRAPRAARTRSRS